MAEMESNQSTTDPLRRQRYDSVDLWGEKCPCIDSKLVYSDLEEAEFIQCIERRTGALLLSITDEDIEHRLKRCAAVLGCNGVECALRTQNLESKFPPIDDTY